MPRRSQPEPDIIEVKGAREHNLKVDTLEIPKKQLVVITGVSGSGKSSLAFDTLYAEGQRRYVESLSAYARQFLGQMEKPQYDARQFLGQMEKPQYDHIRGLSPTIAIQQKSASSNPRSTVGTVTEIYDYLRVLYARVGEQRCHQCGGPVSARSANEIVNELASLPSKTKVSILAPKVDNRKGEFRDLLKDARASGYARVQCMCITLDAPEPSHRNYFGGSVAISGNIAAIGAPRTWDDKIGTGTVYLYQQNDSNQWSLLQSVTASDGLPRDRFGYDVAISANNLVVGAIGTDNPVHAISRMDFTGSLGRSAGSVYMFQINRITGCGYLPSSRHSYYPAIYC